VAFKEEDILPSSLPCSSSERPEVQQECQSSLLQELLDFIPVMKCATSKELMFDRDHTSCTRKPCARPSLPPHLLYKVSKFHYDVISSFTATSPPHFSLCEIVGKSISTEQRPWGLGSPGRSTLVGGFFCPPVSVFTQLLSSLPLPSLSVVRCYSE